MKKKTTSTDDKKTTSTDDKKTTSAAAPAAVNVHGASTITGFPVATLNGWRVKGGGPPFLKISRSVRYRVADLHAWMDKHVVASTAEVAANQAMAEGA